MCEECGCKLLGQVDPEGMVAMVLDELPGATLIAVGVCGNENKISSKVLTEADWLQRESPKDPQ